MAKKSKRRRKLAGAALAAHLKKVGKAGRRKVSKKSRRKAARKAMVAAVAPKAKRTSRRKRHMVTRYHRKGGHVKGYNRHGANVKSHWSNPFGRGIPGALAEGVMTAGVVLGTLYVVGLANRQLERFGPTQAGWGNIAGKLAIALAAGYGAGVATRKGYISSKNAHVIMGASFLPLSLGLLNRFLPQVAGQISLAGDEPMNAEMQADLEMNVPKGGRTSDYMMQAEMEADLEVETDSTF